jgi:hypothetical protein
MEIGMLIQWLSFFGIASIFLLPAFLLWNIAKRNNERGWVYFLLGMALGVLALQAGRLMIYVCVTFVKSQKDQPYLFIVMFITAYVIIGLGVVIVKRRMRKLHN